MTRPRLLLNMIVKNEAARIERCLASVAPWIAGAVIVDTGSTDDTMALVYGYLGGQVPTRLCEIPFEDFSQARNAALLQASHSLIDFDYLLLVDADMELVVEDPGWLESLPAGAGRLLQRAGALAYWNTRLLSREALAAGAAYRGVTHEYLSTPEPAVNVTGAWFRDRADGANRPGKLERDLELLKGQSDGRSVFYRAQTLRDMGLKAEAIDAYSQRSTMPGWEEEGWRAALEAARLAHPAHAVESLLAAWSRRPTRAEPIVDLARLLRERGLNAPAAVLAEHAMGMAPPEGDLLFVEESAYSWGPRQEFAIAGYYLPDKREAAGKVCNALALDRAAPAHVRALAFTNLHFYLRPLAEHCPSWRTERIAFVPEPGWLQQNVSITRHQGRFKLLQRTHNYTPIVDGVVRFRPPEGDVIRTRNFLFQLDDDLALTDVVEIGLPAEWPDPPAYDQVLGWEDMRLFTVGDKLMTVANVRELNREGWCQFVRGEIRDGELIHEGVISQQPPVRHEKNWMPIEDGSGRLIYLCDPGRVVDLSGRTVADHGPAPIFAETFRGGSQAVVFPHQFYEFLHDENDRGLLALVHEAEWRGPLLFYRHRFALFDQAGALLRASPAFYFRHLGLEYCAGLCWHPDGRLIVSHGCHEAESWLGTVDPAEVAAMLGI
jgi:hypothetical protein